MAEHNPGRKKLGGESDPRPNQQLLPQITSRLVSALEENKAISSKLRTALLIAVLGKVDVRTVGALARACSCDRTTLWRHWKQGIGAADPKYVLDFIHLMRMLGSGKTPGRGTRYYRLLTKDLGLRPTRELDLAEVVLYSSPYLKLEHALRGDDAATR
jgi:hypothetical protein